MSRARAGETGHARAHPRGPTEGHAAAPRGARHQLGLRRDEPLLEAPLRRRRPVGRVPQCRGRGASRRVCCGRPRGRVSFPLTAGQAAALRELTTSARPESCTSGVLADTVTKFDAASIRHRVLKGAALAYCVYDDPGVRPYADVDLLVPSADFDRAMRVADRDSARRVRGEPPGFVRRFGKSVELIRSDGISIDLHRSLAPGAWAVLIDADAMFDSRVRFTVADATAGLGPAERFIHSSFHATVGSGSLRLLSLRDVVQTALSPDLDPQGARALAARWQATSVIAAAVSLRCGWVLEPSDFGTGRLGGSVQTVASRPRRLLAQHTVGDDDPRARALEMVRGSRDPGQVRYLAALLNPSRAYLRSAARPAALGWPMACACWCPPADVASHRRGTRDRADRQAKSDTRFGDVLGSYCGTCARR